jgi:hypothetical protein
VRPPGKAVLVVTVDVSREKLERETGIEPATNGLGSRYSTIELLPLSASRVYRKTSVANADRDSGNRPLLRAPIVTQIEVHLGRGVAASSRKLL